MCFIALVIASGCTLIFDEAGQDLPDCYKVEPGCPEGEWQEFNGSCSCYITEFADDRGTQREGHDRCENMGAHMLVIETEVEQDAVVVGLGAFDDFHLGIFYSDQNWQWVTGEILTEASFSAFNGGLPDPAGQNCGEFSPNTNSWRTELCNDQDGIVCELDGKEGTNPPPS